VRPEPIVPQPSTDFLSDQASHAVRDTNDRPSLPLAPAIVRDPLVLGNLALPSRFFLAPLAGYTGLAYRLVIRRLGGLGLATTDLINARSILEKRPKSFELAQTCPEDRPVSIQLFGPVEAEMCEAARRMADHGASVIDINMGCPVRKVVRNGGGSALMCDTLNATKLVSAVVQAVPIPVTVKMRLGWDAQTLTAPELARSFESVGVAAVIIHGRTRAQAFRGTVDREGIRRVVEAVDRMPVVGNGDVRTIADAERMFRETGCAAVSIGRGALGNPFLFRQLEQWALTGDPGPEPTFDQRIDVLQNHFRGLVETRGAFLACLQIRKVLKWYNYLIRPPKPLYHRLINVPSLEVFDEVVEAIRQAGPATPLPAHHEPRVSVPEGPIDKW
jgi:nifR3 family TIM-barrel protein